MKRLLVLLLCVFILKVNPDGYKDLLAYDGYDPLDK